MATDNFRKNMIEAYSSFRAPELFLAGFFPVPSGGISDTETVSIDIEREDEDISPIVNAAEGPTLNVANLFTTKEFVPPTIDEAMPFNARDFMRRMAGQTEYEATDVGFQAQFLSRALKGFGQLERKIMRNREWQASQILTTGTLTLKNALGADMYTINFLPKAAHFPTTGTAWNLGGANPLGDLESLFDIIRENGLVDVERVLMGQKSFNNFIAHSTVQQHYDNRRIDMGEIAPAPVGRGGKRMGRLLVGAYEVEIWTYTGRGKPPGGSKIKMLPDNMVVAMSGDSRLDTVFGGVPMIVDVDERFRSVLPDRIAIPRATDVQPNMWATPDGKQTMLGLASRPLLIPTGIDTFGALDTLS